MDVWWLMPVDGKLTLVALTLDALHLALRSADDAQSGQYFRD
jgi:hypothetical protein